MSALSPLPASFRAMLRNRVRAELEREGHDGLLVLDTWNVVYLSGFHHSPNERPVGLWVPVAGEPILFVPFLEKEHAEEGHVADVLTYPEFPGETDPILWMIGECRARRLAIDDLPARLLAPGSDMVERLSLTDMVKRARHVKHPEELAFGRAAAGYADICLEAIRRDLAAMVRDGLGEAAIMAHGVAAATMALQRDHGARLGATKLGVTASVHSGPRGALPHGKPLARVPLRGEPIIAGIGASVGGYHAESGVTLVYGEPDADTLRCLEVADAARRAAIAALVPGARCDAVDRAARAIVVDAGLGAHLRHRIGHGMGVQGHEGPWLAPGDATPVAPGMVFSNEPGIYRPGKDGYRTIETMIVTGDGVELPSRFQSTLTIAGRVIAA